MADKKISELGTAAAVYDADDFALVQDGDTKQVNASAVKAYVKDGLSKSDVGLGNVDNTSDANKPVSTATQTALDLKQDAASAATLTGTQTLTNKTISGSSNTLSNIGNSSLTNSSITINGNAVSLGGSTTVSAATTNTLTIGTGLSGTSFNGASATTIAIDSSVVTLTGTQTLTNKTLTSPVISGGTANNVAIGGTTPAAGAFTTLSSTGNTTLGDQNTDTLTINGTAVSIPNNLNFDSNTLFIDAANNSVGVYTATNYYNAKLSVGGAITSGTDTSTGGSVILQGYYTSGSTTNFGTEFASGGPSIGYCVIPSKATAGAFLSSYPGSIDRYAINMGGGGIRFFTGGTQSPTIGSAATLSQDMTLTSKGLLVGYTSDSSLSGTGNAIFSGNVGIGTSSPSDILHIQKRVLGAYTGGVIAGGLRIDSGASAADGNYAHNGITFYGDADNASFIYQIHNSNFTSQLAIGTNNTERLRIGSAGECIWKPDGTTSAMTLDASGNLLVGATSISTVANTGVKILPNGDGAGFARVATVTTATTDGQNVHYSVYSTGASAYRFYVGSGGTISATNTTISSLSDQRLKENIQDLDVGLSSILALKPRKFDWKAGKGKDIKGDRGFIAQEFEQVFPDLIDTWKDEPPEGEEPYKSVRQDLIPVMVKAIQELHAEIELLKAKVN